MRAVRLCALTILRRRRVGAVAFAALVVVAGGAVLAAFAGASRTASAASRLYARGRVEDIEVDRADFPAMDDLAKIKRLPEVEDATALPGTGLCVRPCARGGAFQSFAAFASPDGGFGRRM